MILFRYLYREVYLTLIATTLILLVVIISNQFAHYIHYAAAGKLTADLVLQLMALQVPLWLGLLLPLGLYLAIMIGYGRLNADSEMIIFRACGVSQKRIIRLTLGYSAIIAVVVMLLSFWIQPIVAGFRTHIVTYGSDISPIEHLMPKQFQALNHGKQVIYIDKTSTDHHHLYGLFLAQLPGPHQHEWDIVSASTAKQWHDRKTNANYILLDNGYRYIISPKTHAMQVIRYQQYGFLLPHANHRMRFLMQRMTINQLWAHRHNLAMAAELQWRMSLPLMALILPLIAVPLSRVKPRQGRYAKLVPAIIIYIAYADLLFVSKTWIAEGKLPASIGLWWLHGIMLLIALGLYGSGRLDWMAKIRRFFGMQR